MGTMVRAVIRAMAGEAKEYGSNMASHMPVLHLLARHWSFGEIVELGVGSGWSTLAILSGVCEAQRHFCSYDLDPSCRAKALAAIDLPDADPRLSRWEFRSQPSPECAANYKDGSISFLFLDTSHLYEQTKVELSAWLPKIHPQGVMCGHDYFLHEDPRTSILANVKKAVDEFAALHSERFDLQVLPNDFGLFILWPKVSGSP